jgi:hypothetical protein
MEEYGTEWLASSSETLDCTIRSSSDLLFDVARLKLNDLAITLSEELTLEAEESWSGQNMAEMGKESRLDTPPVPNSSGASSVGLKRPPGTSGISSITSSHCSLGR